MVGLAELMRQRRSIRACTLRRAQPSLCMRHGHCGRSVKRQRPAAPLAKEKASGPLALDALEVFDEDEEIPTHHFLTD